MPLGIAFKNQSTVVIASDQTSHATQQAGRLTTFSNRTVMIASGNCAAVEPLLISKLSSKVTPHTTTAEVAQLIHSLLLIHVMPVLPEVPGRTELLIAGFDPIRHILEPGFYYLDSAAGFKLAFIAKDTVAIGATAVAHEIISSTSSHNMNEEGMKLLARECFTNTRLRWPSSVSPNFRLAVITPHSMKIENN